MRVCDPVCGDGVKDGTEECDAGADNGDICTPFYGESCDYCSATCTIETMTGPFCGDEIKNGSEACDGIDGVGEHEVCNASCEIENVPYCGDGVVNGTEECDPQAAANYGDGFNCSEKCTIEENEFESECNVVAGNLLTNGDFELPIVTDPNKWHVYANGTADLGWTVEWENASGAPATANLELQSGVNGWLPYSGSQYAELDTDWTPGNNEPALARIYQNISTTPGTTYQLYYYYSPRPDVADNGLEVRINGNVMQTRNISGVGKLNTFWNYYLLEFEADSATTKVEFAGVGTADSLGVFVDNISLYATDCVAPTYGSLTFCKFNDVNENGMYDQGTDTPLWWEMTIVDKDGDDAGETWYTATPADTGCWTFEGMDLGQYEITEATRDGWTQSYPGNDQSQTVDLTYLSPDVTVTFLNYELPTYPLHGFKWNDLNGDGEYNGCESPEPSLSESLIDDISDMTCEPKMSGWTIFIDEDENGVFDDGEQSAITSSDPDPMHFGWYWFTDLPAGDYRVCEVNQLGWEQTYPNDPYCHEVTLPDQNPEKFAMTLNYVYAPEYNFGNKYYEEKETATVSGYKYEDLNQNGVWDDGELPLNDWEICQESSGSENTEVVIRTSTFSRLSLSEDDEIEPNITCVMTGSGDWADGYYEFIHYGPAHVVITETMQDGWTQTAPVSGFYEFDVEHPIFYENNDFGNYYVGEEPEPYCGDEIVDDGEECDDGNNVDADGCSALCEIEEGGGLPECGNSVLETGETCDDGNVVDGDGCSAICTIEQEEEPICGDGTVDEGETCDDGNTADGDGCSATCTVEEEEQQPVCGNDVKETGEECDGEDGVTAGYTCSDTCTLDPEVVVTVCGNDVKETGEECDGEDGVTDGYQCSATCELEIDDGSVLGEDDTRTPTTLPATGASTFPIMNAMGAIVLGLMLRAKKTHIKKEN